MLQHLLLMIKILFEQNGEGKSSSIQNLILNTSQSTSKVDRLKGLLSIDITKYGDLKVIQSQEIMIRDMYAPKESRQNYVHQRMR